MLKNQAILCFGKDWQESFTSNNHVMQILARENTVLWINSLAMRSPSWRNTQDRGKVIRKCKEFFQGVKHVKDKLYVYTPLVIPFWKFTFIARINRVWLILQIRMLLKKLHMDNVQLWIFYPTAETMIGAFQEQLVVYYCTDQWSGFSYLNKRMIETYEQRLLKKANIVFATSQRLYEIKKTVHPRVYCMPHGVDGQLFQKATRDKMAIPADMRAIAHPVIGFYGLIQDWIDFKLLRSIASNHPEWSLVLVGKVVVDTALVKGLSNVFFLGEKPYSFLPQYSAFFDVAIIPYDVRDPRMQTVNPTKLTQYLASGLAVVSVDIPEVRRYKDVVYIAQDYVGFIKGLEESLAKDNQTLRLKRQAAVAKETWDHKVEQMSEIIAQDLI